MKNGKERFMKMSKKGAAGVTLALLMGSGGAMGLAAQGSTFVVKPERQVATVPSKFYCNIKPLTAEERARHKQLSKKLMAARKKGMSFNSAPVTSRWRNWRSGWWRRASAARFLIFILTWRTKGSWRVCG